MRPVTETFFAFLRLGLTGFGGPVAHLGHFRQDLVRRRGWVDEREFAETVALCQFLPGPTSSQVGFAIGLRRAGLAGGLAAWVAFTAPSAALLAAAGWTLAGGHGVEGAGWLAGLRAFAAAVVAQAIIGMVRTLAPTAGRLALSAAVAGALVIAARSTAPAWIAGLGQPAAIALGAAAGMLAFRHGTPTPDPAPEVQATAPSAPTGPASGACLPRGCAASATAAFVVLVALAVFLPPAAPILEAAACCVRAGALVFGGGHVVLPLLEQPFTTAGWLDRDAVVSGYALAQAVPGPLFTLAAYLGAAMGAPAGGAASAAGAAVLTAAVFLPGLLLVVAAMPAWHRLRGLPGLRAALGGANCAVIGVLSAAWLQEVLPAAAEVKGGTLLAASCLAVLLWGERSRGVPLPGLMARALPPVVAAGSALAGHLVLGG